MRRPACWGERPAVMGVVNLTPDSFSDGGRFNRLDLALREASRQVSAGADVLDLGAQSTRPGAEEVGAEEELRRLLPSLGAIRSAHPELIISVDTFLAPVAEAALEAGADWINDVSGGRRDPAMLSLVAEAGCPYVLMHSRGDSSTMDACTDYGDCGVVAGVLNELRLCLGLLASGSSVLCSMSLGLGPGSGEQQPSVPGLSRPVCRCCAFTMSGRSARWCGWPRP